MQVVIEIPETMVKDLLDLEADCDGGMDVRPLELVIEAIKNGTLLPKEHGKLVDANEIAQMIEGARVEHESSRTFAENIIRFAPTIIEADKGE